MDWIYGKFLDYIWNNPNIIMTVWKVSFLLNVIFIPAFISYFIKFFKLKKQLSQTKDSSKFQMQIEHCKKVKSLIKTFFNLFENKITKKLLKNSDIEELQRLENEVFDLKNESEYLFNKDIFIIEDELNSLLNRCKKTCQGVGEYYETSEYFSELETYKEQVNKLFDKFFQNKG